MYVQVNWQDVTNPEGFMRLLCVCAYGEQVRVTASLAPDYKLGTEVGLCSSCPHPWGAQQQAPQKTIQEILQQDFLFPEPAAVFVEFRYSPVQDTMKKCVFLICIISNEKTTDISRILDKSFWQHVLLFFHVYRGTSEQQGSSMKNRKKHKARDKGRRTHTTAFVPCGEQAVAPACREENNSDVSNRSSYTSKTLQVTAGRNLYMYFALI
ncbi:uncharacterized protein FN964_008400 isoform 3-T4 [Alca torda]